jgi:hypothetical protein
MTCPIELLRCRRGAAAAEMALVAPLLLLLLFACAELGKYFLDEHVVVKAVRDGARYAARQPMSNYITAAAGCEEDPLGSVIDDTKNLVRTGNTDGTGSRLAYWTSNSTITVESSCSATAGDEDVGGIYAGATFGGVPVGAPVVTISATVPYTSLFGINPFVDDLVLRAEQQAIVTGI